MVFLTPPRDLVARGASLETLQSWAAEKIHGFAGHGGERGRFCGSRRGRGIISLSTLSGRPVTRPDDVLPGDVLRVQWASEDDRFQLVGGGKRPPWRIQERTLENVRRRGPAVLTLDEPHHSLELAQQRDLIFVFLAPERVGEMISAAVERASSKSEGIALARVPPAFSPESDEELLWMEYRPVYGRDSSADLQVYMAFGTVADVCSAPVPRLNLEFEQRERESLMDVAVGDVARSSSETVESADIEVLDLDSPDDDEFCLSSDFHPRQKSCPASDASASAIASDELPSTTSRVRRRARFRSVQLAIGKCYTWRGYRISVSINDNFMHTLLVQRSTGSLVKAARG
jgi:hypothetical protein